MLLRPATPRAAVLLAALLAPPLHAAEPLPAAPATVPVPPAAPAPAPAAAQPAGLEAENRPIAEIRVTGLQRIPELLVRNQIRLKVGDPYQGKVVAQDIKRITELGRFDRVEAAVVGGADGHLVLTYRVLELPLMETVEIVGAKILKIEDLRSKIKLRPGDPMDRFLLDQAREQMVRMYQDKGCHETKVTVDETELPKGNLRFLVSEGPRLRLRDLRFEGNASFATRVLEHEIKSETYTLIFNNGWLEREKLELDAATLRDYYRDRGWLDAQVGRRIDISRAQRSGVCTFVIDEGPRYAVKAVQVNFVDRLSGQPLKTGTAHVFQEEQIASVLSLHPGDPYEKNKVAESIKNVEDMYGRLGHLSGDAASSTPICRIDRAYHPDKQSVTLVVTIAENNPTTVGKVDMIGNRNTQTKVVLRELHGMTPGRPFDRTRFEYTKENLANTPYFADASITLLGEDGDLVRDAVVQVKEKSTGSISFGVGVSSDLGFGGNIDYTQKNFDIGDTPRNMDDLFSGNAFRGAGQTFNIALSPGNRASNYAVSFTEPSFFETDNYFTTSLGYSSRIWQEWDEVRATANVGVGRRFGRLWSAGINAQLETVKIKTPRAEAPTVVFAHEGTTTATSLGASITRSTVDSVMEPGHGMKDTLAVDRYGALGGEVSFTKISFTHQHFWTLEKDFLGRKTTIGLRGQVGYIPEGGAPFFYNFYAGGHRSLRGFDYRGVGPRGVRNDNGLASESSIGGGWMTLVSLQYSKPIYDDVVRWVVFTDQGTLGNSPGFDDWRITIGTGLRIKVPFLGQAPLALDFGIPIKKIQGDETQIFSFDFSMPLQ